MTFYRLYLEGVYEQGTCGLFTSIEDAKARARELWEISDGYHDFVIEELTVDHPVPKEGLAERLQGYLGEEVDAKRREQRKFRVWIKGDDE